MYEYYSSTRTYQVPGMLLIILVPGTAYYYYYYHINLCVVPGMIHMASYTSSWSHLTRITHAFGLYINASECSQYNSTI